MTNVLFLPTADKKLNFIKSYAPALVTLLLWGSAKFELRSLWLPVSFKNINLSIISLWLAFHRRQLTVSDKMGINRAVF